MSWTRTTRLFLLPLLCTSCVIGGEHYPPALPEERQLVAADTIPDAVKPSGAERVPLSDVSGVTVPQEDLMRDSPSAARSYTDLKRQQRQRPRMPVLPERLLHRVAYAPTDTPTLADSPASLPPASEWQPSPLPRRLKAEKAEDPATVLRQANAASLVKPRAQWIRGGIIQYPFEQGRTYLVVTSQDNPATIFLPPGQKMSAPLMLDKEQIECLYPEPDIKPYRESIVCMAKAEKAVATTPLIMRSGVKLWLKFETIDGLGVRGVTWSIPRETYELLQAEYEESGEPQSTATTAPGMPQIDYTRLHEGYKIEATKGSPPWVPERVFDDGVRTFIKFREALKFGNTPAVFTLHTDGTYGVVDWMAYEDPHRVDQPSWYVVPHIWPRLLLKGADQMEVTITRGPTRRAISQTATGRQ